MICIDCINSQALRPQKAALNFMQRVDLFEDEIIGPHLIDVDFRDLTKFLGRIHVGFVINNPHPISVHHEPVDLTAQKTSTDGAQNGDLSLGIGSKKGGECLKDSKYLGD